MNGFEQSLMLSYFDKENTVLKNNTIVKYNNFKINIFYFHIF